MFANEIGDSLPSRFALSDSERLRLRCISDVLAAYELKLTFDDFRFILSECDHPKQRLKDDFASTLNAKGFWRIDKTKDPELRQTVLSLVAFHDLLDLGLTEFLGQNDGEGWLIPETLRLADYGLGHDDRAQEHQPVASRLGPRFYDWQLEENVERSREESAAHAELIRQIVPEPESVDEVADEPAEYKVESTQGALF